MPEQLEALRHDKLYPSRTQTASKTTVTLVKLVLKNTIIKKKNPSRLTL